MHVNICGTSCSPRLPRQTWRTVGAALLAACINAEPGERAGGPQQVPATRITDRSCIMTASAIPLGMRLGVLVTDCDISIKYVKA